MKFTPEKAAFYQDFTKLMDEMRKVFDDSKGDLNRVITNNELVAYTTGLITESGPKFNTIVEQSFRYNTIQSQILSKLETDFKDLEILSQKWEHAREVYEFKNVYNKELFEQNNRTTQPIREQLQKVVDMQNKIQLKPNEQKGIIWMTAGRLKNDLETFLKQTHRDLRVHA
jgi:hypothetical protein